jgi:membrane protein implicated in regulation of membrane protease activity
MTIRALVLGAILVAAGLAAGVLGTPETALWVAMVALMGWALVRFLHWRSDLRRTGAGRAAGPLGRSPSEI